MPKEQRSHDSSYKRSRASPYPRSSSQAKQSCRNSVENADNLKEWEEARCPVCMEHPHNAVLLLCSSQDKGCHPYMCDTSYRHSNCLDQFCKVFSRMPSTPSLQESSVLNDIDITTSQGSYTLPNHVSNELISEHVQRKIQDKPTLSCPLCRGQINGWVVKEFARQFMNAKVRSCAQESCSFIGTYSELRKHARHEHPLARPSEADPERVREWRRMERQRDLGDVLSTFQSAIGNEGDVSFSFSDGRRFTIYLLLLSSGSGTGATWSLASTSRETPRSWHHRAGLSGENFNGEPASERQVDDMLEGAPETQDIQDRHHMTHDEQL